jgi:hypothetical protein
MIKIVKNPFFRIIGIIIILYYGLFKGESQNSLNNRFSPNKIKSNISELSDKSIDIIENIKKSKAENANNINDKNQTKND